MVQVSRGVEWEKYCTSLESLEVRYFSVENRYHSTGGMCVVLLRYVGDSAEEYSSAIGVFGSFQNLGEVGSRQAYGPHEAFRLYVPSNTIADDNESHVDTGELLGDS